MASVSGWKHEQRVTQALQSAFPQKLTSGQIMAIIRFSKLVRFRARTNGALNNLVARVFEFCGARFRTVKMQNWKGETFDALVCEIMNTVGGQPGSTDSATEHDDSSEE